jgi:hypothetical protein
VRTGALRTRHFLVGPHYGKCDALSLASDLFYEFKSAGFKLALLLDQMLGYNIWQKIETSSWWMTLNNMTRGELEQRYGGQYAHLNERGGTDQTLKKCLNYSGVTV